ncbi:unnamed protein product [Paramecium sonneborni]|uniref:Uncharacterized protein n=1 Tax=Paramecium sonneborni TaxID=65129 RepID=A0A8S1RBE9_9CILI|nr:unnamed protein product [Paramecium sonneborni]
MEKLKKVIHSIEQNTQIPEVIASHYVPNSGEKENLKDKVEKNSDSLKQ